MRSRPPHGLRTRPSGAQAAAVLVLMVAAASLAGSAFVHADGGLAVPPRRAAVPARAQADPGCDPVVTSVSAASAPAAGGVLLTINGSNFLAAGSPPQVCFGEHAVAPQSATDTEIVVAVPAQRGGQTQQLTVRLRGMLVSNPMPFTYDDPVIDPAPDAEASFGGGTLLTVTGSNFRCGEPRAWLADEATGETADCLVVEASDETLVVALPDWSSPTAVLHLGIVHRDLAARNVLVSGPDLVSVTPSVVPALGGTLITLTGSNFSTGTPADRVIVRVIRAGRSMEAPIVSHSGVEIVARVPEMLEPAGGQVPIGVCVEVAGRKSKTYQQKSDQDIATARYASPVGVPAAGGTPITIFGENFRDGAVAGIAGGAVAGIVVAARAFVFTPPPLAPGVYPVTVEQNGKPSPPVEIEVLAPPTITSVSPLTVPATGRNVLTIHGTNFGISDFGLSRAVLVHQNGTTVDAGPVRWLSSDALAVVLPPGTQGDAGIEVQIAGVSAARPNAFTYGGSGSGAPPELASLSPPGLTRLGGNVITLTGSNFGPAGSATVVFGSTEVAPLTQSDTEITFVQPAMHEGQVQNPIHVEEGHEGSNPLYEGRRGGHIVGIAVGSPASWAGGTTITITGSDFAPGTRARFGAADGATTERPPFDLSPTTMLVTAPEVDEHVWTELSVVNEAGASPPLPYVLEGPRLTGVSTRELSPGGSVSLTVIGANFGPGAHVEIGGAEAGFKEFSPAQDQLKGNPRHLVGPPDVPIRVIDAAGNASDSLMLRWKAPELNAGSDQAARASGGTHLTITGRDFGRGAHLTVTGSGFFSAPTILDRDEHTLVVAADALPPGTYELGVTDDFLGASPPATLTMLAPPTVTSVTPTAVPLAGFVPLTIRGLNFGPPGAAVGMRVAIVGGACVLDATRSADDELVAIVPAGAEGPVDLVVTIDGVADTIPNAFAYSSTAGVNPPPAAPRELALRAGPTPFRGELGLAFAVPAAGPWTLDLFDSRGARVRRWAGESSGALHEVRWDGRDAAGLEAAPGVYFARLTAAGSQRIVRAVKLR